MLEKARTGRGRRGGKSGAVVADGILQAATVPPYIDVQSAAALTESMFQGVLHERLQ